MSWTIRVQKPRAGPPTKVPSGCSGLNAPMIGASSAVFPGAAIDGRERSLKSTRDPAQLGASAPKPSPLGAGSTTPSWRLPLNFGTRTGTANDAAGLTVVKGGGGPSGRLTAVLRH